LSMWSEHICPNGPGSVWIYFVATRYLPQGAILTQFVSPPPDINP
jgi:hypothetical protein